MSLPDSLWMVYYLSWKIPKLELSCILTNVLGDKYVKVLFSKKTHISSIKDKRVTELVSAPSRYSSTETAWSQQIVDYFMASQVDRALYCPAYTLEQD